MVFLKPVFLWGLLLVAIPIIIHLFSFRKQRVLYFSSLRFLREIDTQNRRRSRIIDWILLMIRILIVILLVLGFAQPVITSNENIAKESSGLVVFHLDNSPSMQLPSGGDQTGLERAKMACQRILQQLPPSTRYLISSNGDQPADLVTLEREPFENRLNQITQDPYPFDLSLVMNRISLLTEYLSVGHIDLFVFSDFQVGSLENTPPNGSDIFLHPTRIVPDVVDNLILDSCWFDRPYFQPGQEQTLSCRITNQSGVPYNDIPVKLMVNDTLKTIVNVSIPPEGIVTTDLTFLCKNRGWNLGTVSISDYPVAYDNTLHFVFSTAVNVQVLHLYEQNPNPYLVGFFGGDPQFSYQKYPYRSFPFADFNRFDFVILEGIMPSTGSLSNTLEQYLEQGGSSWIIPEAHQDIEQTNQFLSAWRIPKYLNWNTHQASTRIPSSRQGWLEQVVLNPDANVQMPTVSDFLVKTGSSKTGQDLLLIESGYPVLTRFSVNQGIIHLQDFPLESASTDLMNHPLFIPLIYDMATYIHQSGKMYHPVNRQELINLDLFEDPEHINITIESINSAWAFKPRLQTDPVSGKHQIMDLNVPETGFYRISSEEEPIGWLALNTDRRESLLLPEGDSLVAARLEKFSGEPVSLGDDQMSWQKAFLNRPGQQSLSPWLLLIALLCLGIESIWLRIKK